MTIPTSARFAAFISNTLGKTTDTFIAGNNIISPANLSNVTDLFYWRFFAHIFVFNFQFYGYIHEDLLQFYDHNISYHRNVNSLMLSDAYMRK